MQQHNSNQLGQENQVCHQLPLLEPGSQGWKNPQPNKSLIRQLRSPQVKGLKTKQLQDRLNIPQREIDKCKMGVVLSWGDRLIWHKGHNRWAIYERSAV